MVVLQHDPIYVVNVATLSSPFAEAFLSAVLATDRARFSVEPEALAAILAAAFAEARRAWPGVEISADDFAAWIGARASQVSSIAELNATDLYLACGCARGDAAALAAFETHFLKVLKARTRDEAAADDLRQMLRRQLFVAEPGGHAKIADYAGTGALRSWLHVLAVRAAIRLEPRREIPVEDEQLVNLPGLGGNPELRFLKDANRAAFKEAFHEALASLPSRAQNVLRQHYIDGLSIDQLGLLHDTHRTTTARWLREAREALMSGTKKALMRRARVSPDECESILRDVQSQLDLSIRSLLGR
jgi:RNA polymerase sigma-70 factor, ECF subfamily